MKFIQNGSPRESNPRFPIPVWPGTARTISSAQSANARSRLHMGFSDTFKKRTEPHVDTPAQAKARSDAVAEVKAKADAKTARAAGAKAGKKAERTPPTATQPTKK